MSRREDFGDDEDGAYYADRMMDREYYGRGQSYSEEHDLDFADPGGNSALRAAGVGNPRNLPCPDCESPNRLTPKDVALGYCCDSCADRKERGFDY